MTDLPSWAFVGNEIICIKDPSKIGFHTVPLNIKLLPWELPIFKAHYIIDRVNYNTEFKSHYSLQLKGLPHMYEIIFFGPLIKKSQENDIEIFNKLTDDIKTPETV